MGSGASAQLDLIAQMRSPKSSTRNQAVKKLLGEIQKDNKAYRFKLGEENTGFIQNLVYILQNCDDTKCLEDTAVCLWWFSFDNEFRNVLGSEKYGLMPVIMNTISKTIPIDGNLAKSLFNVIVNCALTNTVHDYWFSINLPELYANLYHQHPNSYQLCNFFRNLLSKLSYDSFDKFIKLNVHEIAINTLQQNGPNPRTWKERYTGFAYYCLVMLVDFLSYPEGTNVAKTQNLIDYMYELLNSCGSNDQEGLRAAYCLSFLVGREEGNDKSNAILGSHPQVVKMLIEVFDTTLELKPQAVKTNVPFGMFCMRVITSGLKALSISDTNKKVLVGETNLLGMLEKTLRIYAEDREELSALSVSSSNLFYAGGGGKDVQTAENTIELLVQLSFYYDSDEELQKNYMTTKYALVDILKTVMDITGTRSVSTTHKQQANILLKRLDINCQKRMEQIIAAAPAIVADCNNSTDRALPSDSNIDPVLTVDSNKGTDRAIVADSNNSTDTAVDLGPTQHVMISYAWGAKKPNVIALTNELRVMGYDVWRDEDGSSIVGSMSGSIDDVMADAIQNSYAVIICVSPQYKDSVNCRSEAKYCQARVHTANLKLIYVMMDEHYHTRSSPNSVDGWLGFMVGSELWYRLWDDDYVNETAQSIAALLGDHAKKGVGCQPAVTNNFQSTTQHPIKNYSLAFKIITDPENLINESRVKKILKDIGITEAEEMTSLEPHEVEEVAGYLKRAKKQTFLKAMGLN